MKPRLIRGLVTSAVLAVAFAAVLGAQQGAPIAEAASKGDREAVRALIKKGLDVNAAQGDGTTALHWAAMKGDAELTQMLIYAGANLRATTRIGAYTPLFLAARGGYSDVVSALVAAGADVKTATANGTTPLMIAAAAGDTKTVTTLVENGSDVNARESYSGETPLMFAAGFNRADAVKLLLARGADPRLTTKVTDLSALTAPEEEQMARQNSNRPQAQRPAEIPGATRSYRYNELISTQGGISALLLATRQGYVDTVNVLLDGGADINQLNAGDRTSPLLMAIINGHFDLATSLLEKGANPNLAAFNGVAPLFAVVNMQWAPKSLYPNSKAYQQQQTTYLELMQALLEKGADPNARVQRKVWYQSYNSDYAGVDESGATPFWRAAYANDVAAMRLLVASGADPNIPTFKPGGRPFAGEGVRQTQDVSGLPPIPVRRPRRDAAARGLGRRVWRGLRGQLASLRADGIPARDQIPGRRARRGCERRGPRRQHAASPGRVARRHRVDPLPGLERRRRDARQPRRQHDGRHGQRPRPACAAVPRDPGRAREARRQEQPPVHYVLKQRSFAAALSASSVALCVAAVATLDRAVRHPAEARRLSSAVGAGCQAGRARAGHHGCRRGSRADRAREAVLRHLPQRSRQGSGRKPDAGVVRCGQISNSTVRSRRR